MPKFDAPYVMNKDVGEAILDKYSKPGAVDAGLRPAGPVWDDLLSNFQADSPDPHANRMLNVWNQYQCMATFNMSRSASMYETGIGRGMGFRDSNQDLLGFVHMIPSRARERILDIAATQLSDGTCYHQYQPLDQEGQRRDRRRLLRRPPVAHPLDLRVHQGDRRPRHPGRVLRLRRQARTAQDDSAPPPGNQHRLHHEEARPARPAADRPRRLERLPEPELLFHRAQRKLPVRRRRQGQPRPKS